MDIEDQIRRAMEQGQFDNLPGKGKPLRLDENLLEDPEWRLAHHVLQTGGFSLPWIENQRAIESEIEAARADLARSWSWRQAALVENRLAPGIEVEWQRAVADFRAKAAALNRRIFDNNLQVPAPRFQRPALQADEEITRLIQPQAATSKEHDTSVLP